MMVIFKCILIVFLILLFAHLLGFAGSQGPVQLDRSIISALVMMTIFSIMILHFSTLSGLFDFMGNISNAIPFVNLLSDWGTLRAGFLSTPLTAAKSFFDTVLMGAMVNVAQMLTGVQNIRGPKTFLFRMMLMLFTALVTLWLLTFVKTFWLYEVIVSFIGIVIASLSVGSIIGAIWYFISSLFRKPSAIVGGFLSWLLFFTRLPILRVFRSSFYQALGFTLSILVVEHFFGSMAQGAAVISLAVTLFVPILCMCLVIFYLICVPFFKT